MSVWAGVRRDGSGFVASADWPAAFHELRVFLLAVRREPVDVKELRQGAVDGGAVEPRQSGGPAVYRDESAWKEYQDNAIRADWTRALEPGISERVDRPRLTSNSAQSVQRASHQPPAEGQGPPPLQNPVFEQPLQQPSQIAQGAWHQETVSPALGGYCPVELVKNERWIKGDSRLVEVYQGTTYVFSSAVQRECFLIDPERYIPAFSGRDPVLMRDHNQQVPGRLEHCATYNGRLYMFSSASSLARFQKEPQRYASPVR